jgi:hypothetical protein
VKAPGFVRRPHRSRGRSKAGLGTRGVPVPLRAIGSPRSPTRVPASDSEQASRASCRSLVESRRPARRELDSQPGNRCLAARSPSPVRGETRRSRVCSTFTLAAESRRAASGSPVVVRRSKALRAVKRRHRSCGPAGSGSKRSVRGKPVRVRRRKNTPTHRANAGDPKRVKRHEARHSPRPGKTGAR